MGGGAILPAREGLGAGQERQERYAPSTPSYPDLTPLKKKTTLKLWQATS